MSLYDKSSLLQVPSLYKDGTLVSTIPEDRSGDFTVVRGSNLSATRIGPDGYIKKGYENLLLQSNTFSNAAWNKAVSQVTGGQLGYDSTNDAWLLEKTNANGRVEISVSGGNVLSYSVYAKKNASNQIRITGDTCSAYFNLNDGTLGSVGATTIASIDLIGDGWYRCTATAFSSTSIFRVYPAENNSTSSLTTGSVYIQDAMLNQGLVAYPYIETTTAPVAGGILEDMPRLDWSGSCPSLLLEPSRTNLIDSSEWIGSWSLSNISVSIDDTISPEGYANVSKLTAPSTGLTRAVSFINYNVGTTYTFSAWIKNIDASVIQFLWYDGSSNRVYKTDEVNTETFTRVSFSFTPTNTNSTLQLQAARDLPTGESFYMYGAQLEQDASYPTSYIPTYGVSQTRLNDYFKVINQEGLFGTNKGTFFMEFSFNENNKYIGIGDTYLSDKVTIGLNASGTNQIRSLIKNNGVNINLQGSGTTLGETIKACVSYGSSGFNLFMNGNLEASNATPSNLSQFSDLIPNVDVRDLSTSTISGNIKQILVFPTALSDSECIALTTIT